jgi:folate-binding protein YgfZ
MTTASTPAVAPASPLLALPGAVAAEGVDAGIAAHYGNPLGEQRRLAEDVAFVDRSNRGVLVVPGADRLSWLHSLTSQHLSALPAMRGTEALVLSPHGHVEHHLMVADDGTTTWLDVEPGTAPALLAFLDAMRFLLRVDPRDATADWAVLTVGGPATDAVLSAALEVSIGPEPYDVAPLPGPDAGWVRRRPWPGDQAVDLVVPRRELEVVAARLQAAGAAPAGIDAFEALRVAARQPRLAFETDHRTIPHEVGWLETAVHLNKGCYRGQETVARVHNLGRPPRRLVLLHLDGSGMALPRTGDPVATADRSVGFVTTAVRHYELGSIALGLVKRNTADTAITSAGPCAAIAEN